ncbi:DUF1559 domain-containing protein [Gimesia sp.]|uniref:DUF1559 domain-containing protein n=1 Tax=Gimesia sp. TaxID=2024833 RepID=UPI0025C5F29E|nr:DUF1559 domain-containing protein [Gimesia sp.]
MGLALHNYHDTHRVFPPATINAGLNGCNNVHGTTGILLNHTCYQMILPFIDQANIYNLYNWSLPSGRANHGTSCTGTVTTDQYSVVKSPVPVFLCPSDPGNQSNSTTSSAYYVSPGWRTSYGVVSHTTSVAGSTPGLGSWGSNTSLAKGTLGPNGAAKFRDITDGTSNTMVLCETQLIKTSTSYGPYWNAATHTFYIAAGSSGYTLNFDNSGGKQYAWGAGSFHVGGGHILLADGAVRFLSENVDRLGVVQAMISVRGGEIIPEF